MHNSKFALTNHSWDEPLNKITENPDIKIPVITPEIGEPVFLNDTVQSFITWWKNMK